MMVDGSLWLNGVVDDGWWLNHGSYWAILLFYIVMALREHRKLSQLWWLDVICPHFWIKVHRTNQLRRFVRLVCNSFLTIMLYKVPEIGFPFIILRIFRFTSRDCLNSIYLFMITSMWWHKCSMHENMNPQCLHWNNYNKFTRICLWNVLVLNE